MGIVLHEFFEAAKREIRDGGRDVVFIQRIKQVGHIGFNNHIIIQI